MYQEQIRNYCRYQERSHKEVRNKLYELGCTTPEVEECITELISEDILNEERFARAIARGKFRLKKWGRIKISQQLKYQQVSDYCIRKAMGEIPEEDYRECAKSLAINKLNELGGKGKIYVQKQKVYRYLLQKGYEPYVINDVLNEITA